MPVPQATRFELSALVPGQLADRPSFHTDAVQAAIDRENCPDRIAEEGRLLDCLDMLDRDATEVGRADILKRALRVAQTVGHRAGANDVPTFPAEWLPGLHNLADAIDAPRFPVMCRDHCYAERADFRSLKAKWEGELAHVR